MAFYLCSGHYIKSREALGSGLYIKNFRAPGLQRPPPPLWDPVWHLLQIPFAIYDEHLHHFKVEGDRGAGDWEKRGAGGVREAGEEGAGSRRKREKLCNIANILE